MRAVNLNDGHDFTHILEGIMQHKDENHGGAAATTVHNIVLFEGILVHLKAGTTPSLLMVHSKQLCQWQPGMEKMSNAHLEFTNLFKGMMDRDARVVLVVNGNWILNKFIASPTQVPHLGCAHLACN